MTSLPTSLLSLPQRLLPLDDVGDRPPRESRQAAVLVLLFPRRDEIHFPLTVRPEYLTRHAGQIALPGGLVEKSDADLWHAAVRETREELGVDPSGIRPLGRLTTHHLRVSDYHIAPLVGWTEKEPAMAPNAAEVAEVFCVALDALLDPASVEREEWTLRERQWQVTFYRLDGRVVWGATARMLHELACRLEGREPNLDDGPGSVLPVE